MRFRLRPLPTILAGGLLLSASIALAGGPPPRTEIEVKNAWVRWVPANLPSAGYMTLRNTGSVTQVLIGCASADYQSVHLHQTVHEEGIMSMRAVKSLEIKPQESVRFARLGYHLMLMQPRRPLHAGDHVKIRLQFEQSPSIDVDFVVREEPAT
jgi:copper(I)-binding protein